MILKIILILSFIFSLILCASWPTRLKVLHFVGRFLISHNLKRGATGVLFSHISRVKWLRVDVISHVGSSFGCIVEVPLETKLKLLILEERLLTLALSNFLAPVMFRWRSDFQRHWGPDLTHRGTPRTIFEQLDALVPGLVSNNVA